jgi:hypothetical protein
MLENPEAQTEQKSNNKGGEGFISQLTTKVIDNLQFTMKNIHIRYEDNISDPGHAFAAGITLKELSALSTDDKWVPKFISEPSNAINKVLNIKLFFFVSRRSNSTLYFSLHLLNHCLSIGIPTPDLSQECIMRRQHKFILIW